MVDKNKALSLLVEAGEDAVEAARSRAEGRRAIGYVITDVPVEFLHAAGLYPVAVLGHRGEAGPGREHLQSFSCSYSRSVLDLCLDGSLDFLEGIITPFVCDTTRAIDFTLRYAKPFPYIECYRPPKSLTGRGARDYLINEIGRIKKSIEDFVGGEIPEEKLAASVKIYNKARGHLRRLSPMREYDPGSFYAVCRAFMVLPVEEFIELAEVVEPDNVDSKGDEVPLVLAAKVAEPGDLAQVLNDLGAKIVADDLVTGSRLFAVDLDEEKCPIEESADRQINNIPFVGLLQGPEDRSDFLVRTVKESGAKGILLSVQKFCEPFELDVPEIRERMKSEGIPALVIETDYEPEVPGALRTRIEAFLEMIRHG